MFIAGGLTKKKAIRRRVYDELDKRFFHKLCGLRRWVEHVYCRIHGKHASEFCQLEQLHGHAFSPKSRKSFIPYSCQ